MELDSDDHTAELREQEQGRGFGQSRIANNWPWATWYWEFHKYFELTEGIWRVEESRTRVPRLALKRVVTIYSGMVARRSSPQKWRTSHKCHTH
jgi:hypothetical protein